MANAAEKLPPEESPSGVGLDDLRDLVKRCLGTLETLRSLGMTPDREKRLIKRYRAQRVAEMVGLSRMSIRTPGARLVTAWSR